MERTFVMLKPDAVQRQLVGQVMARFEAKGLKIAALKMLRIDRSLAERQYAVHKGKDFYEPLLQFMTAGPVVAMVLEGNDAVRIVRSMMGPTFGPDAPPGTIRGDFGVSKRYNLIHGSDAPASAEQEIPLFFTSQEIQDYELLAETWLYAPSAGKRI
jgi:nucleoside-diphosphate kinase